MPLFEWEREGEETGSSVVVHFSLKAAWVVQLRHAIVVVKNEQNKGLPVL